MPAAGSPAAATAGRRGRHHHESTFAFAFMLLLVYTKCVQRVACVVHCQNMFPKPLLLCFKLDSQLFCPETPFQLQTFTCLVTYVDSETANFNIVPSVSTFPITLYFEFVCSCGASETVNQWFKRLANPAFLKDSVVSSCRDYPALSQITKSRPRVQFARNALLSLSQ